MKVSSSKEKILKKIREALSEPVPLPFPKSEGNTDLFPPSEKELDILFAEEFTGLQGKFAFCFHREDAAKQVAELIEQRKWSKIYFPKELKPFLPENAVSISVEECEVAFTACHYLVARTGTIVLSSALPQGRTASAYAPVHVCIANTSQLVYDTREAIAGLKAQYGNRLPSFITFAAGPSRTIDIEKTMVVGVHGPCEVFLFLIDEPTD